MTNELQLFLKMVSLGSGTKDELHNIESKAMNYRGNPIIVTLTALKMSSHTANNLSWGPWGHTPGGSVVEVQSRACAHWRAALGGSRERSRVRRRIK